jgi:hypothetical protein
VNMTPLTFRRFLKYHQGPIKKFFENQKWSKQAKVFDPCKPYLSILMFVDKANSIP